MLHAGMIIDDHIVIAALYFPENAENSDEKPTSHRF